MTQVEAIITVFESLGGSRSIKEIEDHVRLKYGDQWQDFGTVLADMVSPFYGGNSSSTVLDRNRVLKRVSRGVYALI